VTRYQFEDARPTPVANPLDIAKFKRNTDLVECSPTGDVSPEHVGSRGTPKTVTVMNQKGINNIVQQTTLSKLHPPKVYGPGENPEAERKQVGPKSFIKMDGQKTVTSRENAQDLINSQREPIDAKSILARIRNPQADADGKFTCPLCMKAAKTEHGFKTHMSLHAAEVQNMEDLALSPLEVARGATPDNSLSSELKQVSNKIQSTGSEPPASNEGTEQDSESEEPNPTTPIEPDEDDTPASE
jgi:hypothetical protein